MTIITTKHTVQQWAAPECWALLDEIKEKGHFIEKNLNERSVNTDNEGWEVYLDFFTNQDGMPVMASVRNNIAAQ